MNLKSSSLLLTALTTVGLTGAAYAQDTFTVGAASFNDGAGAGINELYTSTAASSYVVGGTVNVTGGDMTQVATISIASESRVRMRNSGLPSLVLDFSPATAYGTITAGSRTASGTLIGSSIVSSSTWSLELYDSWDDASGSADATTTGFSFANTIGSPLVAPATVHVETVSGTNPFKDPAGTAGNFTTSGGSASTAFLLSPTVVIKGGTWTNAWSYNNIGQNQVRLGHTAFPTLFMTFTPVASIGSEAVGSTIGYGVDRTVVGTGTLLASAIPTSGNFTIEYVDTTNSGSTTTATAFAVLGDVEATATDLSFGLTADTTVQISSPVLSGPFLSAGMPYSGNGTFTIGSAASNFTMAGTIRFSGVGLELNTVTALSQSRLRIRNSAYPGISADFQPSASTLTTITVSNATLTSPNLTGSTGLGSALRGMSIPSGSTFTGEFFEIFDDASNDAQWSNVQLTILAGNAIASATPPATFIDLGVISDASLTTPIAVDTPSWSVAPTFTWFKFTLPSAVNGFDGKFLDMWTSRQSTTGYASDTTITLFNANGRIITFNDDEGVGALAAGSFGLPLQTTPTWAVTTADLPFGGRNGDGIPAGVYYVAVAQFGGSRADGFNVTSSATLNLGTRFHVRTNVQGNVNLTGTLNLNDTSATFAFNRNIGYSVMQGTTVVASGTVVADASSESFSISVPSSVTGAATIEWDGSSFLLRKTNINLTGSALAVGSVSVQNGDVDNSGEVDAADIDEVIADFGITTNDPSDVDVSGEVDAADSDIVIANFGGTND